MKSKSRRELIDGLRYYRKTAKSLQETVVMQQGLIDAQDAIIAVKNRHIDGLKSDLERLSDDKGVRYIKAPDRWTVIKKAEIEPERVECSREIYNEMAGAKDIMCGQIAKALIDAGVVRFETRPIPGRPYTEVTARIDVIPWYALCERVVVNQTKGEITIEGDRG